LEDLLYGDNEDSETENVASTAATEEGMDEEALLEEATKPAAEMTMKGDGKEMWNMERDREDVINKSVSCFYCKETNILVGVRFTVTVF
jgi:hypothetical protein